MLNKNVRDEVSRQFLDLPDAAQLRNWTKAEVFDFVQNATLNLVRRTRYQVSTNELRNAVKAKFADIIK